MGVINFGWLAVWIPSPDWLCHILVLCDICQALRRSRRAWGRGMRAVPQLCIEYPGICLTTEENHGKPVMVTEWRSNVQCRTRFVLSTWPSRATGSTLGQLKYLPSCRARAFPTSAKFESKLSVRALIWSANSKTPRSSFL